MNRENLCQGTTTHDIDAFAHENLTGFMSLLMRINERENIVEIEMDD